MPVTFEALRDLLEVMLGVGAMKAPPLLSGQRSKHWVVQQINFGSEAPFRVSERRIHGHQCIVELT